MQNFDSADIHIMSKDCRLVNPCLGLRCMYATKFEIYGAELRVDHCSFLRVADVVRRDFSCTERPMATTLLIVSAMADSSPVEKKAFPPEPFFFTNRPIYCRLVARPLAIKVSSCG